MDYVAYFDFQDGTGEHGPYPLRTALPNLALCSESFHHAVSQFSISFIPTSDYLSRRASSSGMTKVRILNDGILVFMGLVPPTDTWESNGVAIDGSADLADIQLEVLDYSSYLDRAVQASDGIAWEDFYVCDPVHPDVSIVHRLLALCGLSGDLVQIAVSDTTILHAFSLEDGTIIGDALDSLLWQYGLVLAWEIDHFCVYRWMILTPESTLNLDENVILTPLRAERVEREADSVEVKWYALKDKADCLLYMADLPFGSDNQRSGYPIQPGYLWPEEANVGETWWPYTDKALATLINPSETLTKKNTDFTSIVMTKAHYIDDHIDAGVVQEFTPIFENKRARVAYRNPTTEILNIYYCDIYGDVIYRAAENSVVKNTVDAPKKPISITAEFVHDETSAVKLACSLAYFYGTTNWKYTVRSESAFGLGTVANLRDPASGLNTFVLIIGRQEDTETGIYTYTCISIRPVTIDPTATYQAILPAPLTGFEDPRLQAQRATPGLNSATVILYKRASTTPAKPTTPATYTFATGALAGQDGGWTQGIPAANGLPLWAILATAAATGATDTIDVDDWSDPVILAQDGEDGVDGTPGANTAIVYLYQRAASTPVTTDLDDPLTYTFATRSLTGDLGAWSQTIPSGSNPLYVIAATAYGTGANDTIARSEWSAPVILVQNGATGPQGPTGPSGTNGLNWGEAKSLYNDPTFLVGSNNVVVYNNSGNGTVTHTREAKQSDNPFAEATHNIKIVTNGVASPGAGGFCQLIQPRASAMFVQRIIAKIPVGYNIVHGSDDCGDGATHTWLTPTDGTGTFQEYILVIKCGASGTFSTSGYIYISGPDNTSVTWYVAYAAVFDFTAAAEQQIGLGAKPDYSDFATAGGGYVYVHGYNSLGLAADVNGFVWFDNTKIPVSKGAIRPNVIMDGYIVLPIAGGTPLAAYYQLSDNKFRSIINGVLADLADASYIVIGEIVTSAADDVESVTLYPRAKRFSEIKGTIAARYIGVAGSVASGQRTVSIYGFTGTYLFTDSAIARVAKPGDACFVRGGTLYQDGHADTDKALRVFDGYEWAAPTTEMYPVYRSIALFDLAAASRVYATAGAAVPADCSAYFDVLFANIAVLLQLYSETITVRNRLQTEDGYAFVDNQADTEDEMKGLGVASVPISEPLANGEYLTMTNIANLFGTRVPGLISKRKTSTGWSTSWYLAQYAEMMFIHNSIKQMYLCIGDFNDRFRFFSNTANGAEIQCDRVIAKRYYGAKEVKNYMQGNGYYTERNLFDALKTDIPKIGDDIVCNGMFHISNVIIFIVTEAERIETDKIRLYGYQTNAAIVSRDITSTSNTVITNLGVVW
jgi:hypothetical protein